MARNYIKENQLHFGLDYLSIYWTCKFEEDFSVLNYTNSNYWEIDGYVYVKNKIDKYLYWITFSKDNYPVFSYVKWDSAQSIPSFDCITVYWVAFKMLSIDEILNFLEWNFDLLRTKRFDICMDLEVNIVNVLKKFKELKQKWWTINWRWWIVETQYFWNPSRSKNRRSVVRVYNKIADLKWSKKEKLYWDYLLKSNITRVELEVRRELAQNIHYSFLFDEIKLKGIFKNYLRLKTNIFDNICEEKISLYRKSKDITDEQKQGIYYKNLYKIAFNGYAKNIMRAWTCPVRLLIWEWLIQDSTKIELWKDNVNYLGREERVIKKKYLYSNNKEYEWK